MIPSYKAVELFMKQKGVDFSGLSVTKNKSPRFVNLNNNITAINIEYELHRNNRTTDSKNEIFSKIDSLSLKIATLKDFTTLLFLAKTGDVKNNKTYSTNYAKIINSFNVVYLRNKQLCLYDI